MIPRVLKNALVNQMSQPGFKHVTSWAQPFHYGDVQKYPKTLYGFVITSLRDVNSFSHVMGHWLFLLSLNQHILSSLVFHI